VRVEVVDPREERDWSVCVVVLAVLVWRRGVRGLTTASGGLQAGRGGRRAQRVRVLVPPGAVGMRSGPHLRDRARLLQPPLQADVRRTEVHQEVQKFH